MKAKIRNTEIYFDVAGMQLTPDKMAFLEKPVLFMLHGGPGGEHLLYKQHSLELMDAAQLVFIDNRGCGHSKKTQQKEYTLENNIEDIEALRKHLGLDRICILGTSYGGIVAQGYAIRYSKNVDKLILVSTSPSFRFIEEAKRILNERGTSKQIEASEHLWNGTFKNQQQVKNFFKIMEPLYLFNHKKNKKQAISKSKTIWSREALNQGFSHCLRYFDYVSKLKKISCPTLILAGQQDWISNPKQAKTIAQQIPHAKLKIFKHCGHVVAMDAHEQYIKIIKNFLKTKRFKRKKT